jgi:hypothetical protein
MDNKIIRNSVISGLLFGVILGLLTQSWSAFLVGGGLFGAALGLFSWYVSRGAAKSNKELLPGETVIRSGLANRFTRGESIGGTLFLTDQQLLHKPHDFNIQTKAKTYALTEIREAKAVNNAGIVPNGLLITLHDGSTQKFVVNGRKKWVGAINDQITKLAAPQK